MNTPSLAAPTKSRVHFRPKRGKSGLSTGVVLDTDVVSYLDKIAAGAAQSRNWAINLIIREHAQLTRDKFGEPRLVNDPNELLIKF